MTLFEIFFLLPLPNCFLKVCLRIVGFLTSESSLLSSSCNVSSIELRNKKKATQQWNRRVANDIVLNQIRVYRERMYADNVVNKFWLVRSFSSKHYSRFITNITSESVFQTRTKDCLTRSFLCKVCLTFLRSSRHFNCDTIFAVIV